MLAEERRQKILSLLNSKGSIQVADLSKRLKVTEETIRRDLEILKNRNLLKRIHGGAIAIQNQPEIPFNIRKQKNVEEKKIIAEKAVKLIKPGDIIFLDISSTVMFLAKKLAELAVNDITIITNSATVVLEFANNKNITVISTGGILRANSYSLVGPLANKALSNYFADKFFSSCNGISVKYGATESNELEKEIKINMLKRANQHILLVDHSKFNKVGLSQFASLDDIDIIVSDDSVNKSIKDEFEAKGIIFL